MAKHASRCKACFVGLLVLGSMASIWKLERGHLMRSEAGERAVLSAADNSGRAPLRVPAPPAVHRGAAKPVPPKAAERPGRIIGQCPSRAKSPKKWNQVNSTDKKLIRTFGGARAAKGCHTQGQALVFHVDLDRAKRVEGFAFELSFPDYIVADEPGERHHAKRSTLQLFALGLPGARGPQPMGPAHALHSQIASDGGGAFSHWQEPITAGPYVSSKLRFSTPGNQPLQNLQGMLAVIFPMAPPMGWIEYLGKKLQKHQAAYRELYLLTFPTIAVLPHLIEKARDVRNGTWYVWRVPAGKDFDIALGPGEIHEKKMPHEIAALYGKFEQRGGVLWPPAATYVYYQNKVALAQLFRRTGVKTPKTWIFKSLEEALAATDVVYPVIIKDPYGFSSRNIQQASNRQEYQNATKTLFDTVPNGVEAVVQSKVVALREARVTYINGRPFHGYWRIRQSLKSVSAASNLGGYQDFSFPLAGIAPYIARFANATGVPVGGVDLIWEEASVDIQKEPYVLEVSPTSDINPPSPADWTRTYKEFKQQPNYRGFFFGVRRRWTEQMAIAAVDRYRSTKRHLFVEVDNVVSLSAQRLRRWNGQPQAFSAVEVLRDKPVPHAVDAVRQLRRLYFVRFVAARRAYEDAFNVTQDWLDTHGFEYDDLVVGDARSKVAHLTQDSLLVSDFTLEAGGDARLQDEELLQKLRKEQLPFMIFPFQGPWADVLPKLLREASVRAAAA